jgi:hypothetical protein
LNPASSSTNRDGKEGSTSMNKMPGSMNKSWEARSMAREHKQEQGHTNVELASMNEGPASMNKGPDLEPAGEQPTE